MNILFLTVFLYSFAFFTAFPLTAGIASAQEPSCKLQTMAEMAGHLEEIILTRFPDAQFDREDNKLYFQCDFRDATIFENIQTKYSETISRFSTSQAGVKGAFSIEDMAPSPQKDDSALSSLSVSKDVYDDGYFKDLKWSISVPRLGKLFSAYIFYIRGTPTSMLDELVSFSRVFGSCKNFAEFVPIDEATAIKLAKDYASRDSVAKEIILHDSKVLDNMVSGQWNLRHEIVFRGGCCCACDGECDDIIVRMTSDGGLTDVKVKHWICGGRNKRPADNK